MAYFERISIATALELMANDGTVVVDVRDEDSFSTARIPGAVHLSNASLPTFLESAEPSSPVIVYCYHGNSSQAAAAYLNEKGFDRTYSMDGGFELWRASQPVDAG
jgi:thiosulfate sulfurtransferase